MEKHTLMFLLRSQDVGCVIGYRQRLIMKLMKETGAEIQMETKTTAFYRMIKIAGSHNQTAVAVSKINEILLV